MKLPKNFKTNHSLKKNNSLKLNYASDYFVSCNSEKDLFLIYDFLEEKKIKYWIFGDGTNVILKNNLKGLVIKNNLKGFSVNENSIIVGAGEIWDDIVSKSLNNLSAQIIDDKQKRTLVSASSTEKEIKLKKVKKIEKSSLIGEILAKRAKEKNISDVYFDRGSYKYHGRVKVFAETLRKNGLKF